MSRRPQTAEPVSQEPKSENSSTQSSQRCPRPKTGWGSGHAEPGGLGCGWLILSPPLSGPGAAQERGHGHPGQQGAWALSWVLTLTHTLQRFVHATLCKTSQSAGHTEPALQS